MHVRNVSNLLWEASCLSKLERESRDMCMFYYKRTLAGASEAALASGPVRKDLEGGCVQDGTCRSAAISVGHYMQNDSTDRWTLLRE